MCHHEKFGDIKDGYQYCLKCNKAFPVPPKSHEHIWIEVSQFTTENVLTHARLDTVYIKECRICGLMREYRFGVIDRMKDQKDDDKNR